MSSSQCGTNGCPSIQGLRMKAFAGKGGTAMATKDMDKDRDGERDKVLFTLGHTPNYNVG